LYRLIDSRNITGLSLRIADLGDHQQSGDKSVDDLEAVGVLGRELMAGAARHPDDQGHLGLAAEHVADLGRVVHDLVIGDEREVDRHQLHDGAQPQHGRPDCRADKALFRDRCVHDPLRTELIEEAFGDAVRSAEHTDVLADEVHVFVALHLLGQRFAQRDAIQLFVGVGCALGASGRSGHSGRHQSGSPRSSGRFSHSPAYTYL
jgi:hypothetical protein